jgi:hypothetical protein
MTETAAKKANQWERKLAGYVVAGGAALAAADPAQAAPIYSGVQDIAIGLDQTVDLDLNGDAVVDFQFQNVFLPGVVDERRLQLLTMGTNTAATFSGGSDTKSLAAGVVIPDEVVDPLGLGGTFVGGPQTLAGATEGGGAFGFWFDAVNEFVALEFDIAGQSHYGWARLSVSGSSDVNTAGTATLHDWAYESIPGAQIRTGQTAVPEPGSLGLLALGAVGLAAYRRRRSDAA